jgi:hypothetical protein
VLASHGTLELRYVPAPALVRSSGHELGLLLRGMRCLTSALSHLPVGTKDAIEGGLRAQVGPFVEQREIHLGRRAVDEPVTSQHGQDLVHLGVRELVRRSWKGTAHGHLRPSSSSVHRCSGTFGGHTRRLRAEQRLDRGEALVDHGCCGVSESSLSASSLAKSSDAFPGPPRPCGAAPPGPQAGRSSSSPSPAPTGRPPAPTGRRSR